MVQNRRQNSRVFVKSKIARFMSHDVDCCRREMPTGILATTIKAHVTQWVRSSSAKSKG